MTLSVIGSTQIQAACSALYAAFLRGTLAPFLRASDRPIAMACLRLFAFGMPALPRFQCALLLAMHGALDGPLRPFP